MLGQRRIQELAESILTRSPADQTEVVVISFQDDLTRFANSTIHQHVSQASTMVRIRVVLGTRTGVATTDNLDQQALSRTLENAVLSAQLGPENPDFRGLPGPQPISEVVSFSEATANSSAEQRALGVGTICSLARDAGVHASGALKTTVTETAVFNSLGTAAYYPSTRADINTTILSDSSAGYAAGLTLDLNDLDLEAIGREALERCLRGQNPRSLEPGDYTVILEPYATQDLMIMVSRFGLQALALQEGYSFVEGKFGQQVLDTQVSIWDDGLDPAGIPTPFDFEGVPKERVDLIERGVARAVVYDSYLAGKETGKRSTGHAMPAPNTNGPVASNLFLAPGESTVEEMIAGTERGLLITYFHYTRPVARKPVIITGMTRNGTFLIEKGEITAPVKNLRFTQSYLEALNRVEAIGRQSRLLPLWGMGCFSVPAIKLAGFTFTGATEF
jgi:predicted Zn-dependent protease